MTIEYLLRYQIDEQRGLYDCVLEIFDTQMTNRVLDYSLEQCNGVPLGTKISDGHQYIRLRFNDEYHIEYFDYVWYNNVERVNQLERTYQYEEVLNNAE